MLIMQTSELVKPSINLPQTKKNPTPKHPPSAFLYAKPVFK